MGESLRLQKTVLVKVPLKNVVVAGSSSDGWEFRHILEAPKDDRQGQWYVAWNDQRPISSSRLSAYWRSIFARAPEIARATQEAFQAYPVLIEPNLSFKQVAAKQPIELKQGERVPTEYGEGVRLVINKFPMTVWPDARQRDKDKGGFIIDPMWHLDSAHSQLADARKQFTEPGAGIRIGHLDNGLDARHPASPMRLQRNKRLANAVNLLDFVQRDARGKNPPNPTPPERHPDASHGLGTIGILAGSWVAIDKKEVPGGRIKEYYGWLGGAPFASVVPVRVAPWVVSMSTAELAYSIDYASRRAECDVISMSHGGAPTQAWADAVNAAYERGTAMFAAEGDFFSVVPNPFTPRGIVVPASPVYPAAFRRVVGVTGATADHTSYGRNSLWRLLGNLGGFLKWTARGSYGADGTNSTLLRSTDDADPSQNRRMGQLRAHPIAAYAPNVPWISMRKKDGHLVADGVDLDGAGTSAATPQVAAAAALWLQKHRDEFKKTATRDEWRSWVKTEAVYHALIRSADRRGRLKPDKYLGAGLLRANDALEIDLAEIRSHKPPPRPLPDISPDGSLYFDKAPNDYFDGARGVWSIFGLNSWRKVDIDKRATLRQKNAAKDSYELAMQRLYYNMLLLREWHGGDVPVKDVRDEHGNVTRPRHETMYWKRAERIVKNLPKN